MPKTVEISVDEYLDTRKLSSADGVMYRAARMPRTFDAESRSAVFVMTDETKDSYGDIVRAKGADLSRFEKNPIALLNHSPDLVIGTWSEVEQKAKRIEGKVTLAAAGTAPHVDMTYNLMSQGILRAASIGFMPRRVEKILDEQGRWTFGFDILEWELYECSVVSVPANPAALAKSMKQGDVLARDLIEHVLDTYAKTPSGLIVPREEFEAAYKEGAGNRTTHSIGLRTDDTALKRLESVAERLEKAIQAVAPAVEKADEPEVDPIAKSIEEGVEKTLSEVEPKLDEIDEPERKSALQKLVGGIRSLFSSPEAEEKAADPEPEPDPATTPADPQVQKALQERLAKLAVIAPAE